MDLSAADILLPDKKVGKSMGEDETRREGLSWRTFGRLPATV